MKFLFLLLCFGIYAEPICFDSSGVAVELKEKYGGFFYDTGTVVWRSSGVISVTHRERPASFYPECNFAVTNIIKLGGLHGNSDR